MQTHQFIPANVNHRRCASVRDGQQGMCWLTKQDHLDDSEILTKINPFLTIERDRLAKNLRSDMEAAERFAKQYRDWLTESKSKPQYRAEHLRHAQVWEARAQALSDALNGLTGHTDD